MYALNFALVLSLAAFAYGFPDARIVGGSDAPVGKFPYQVSLRYYGEHFCGGSIISSRYILTAAHCVKGVPDIKVATVHAGTNLLSESGDVYAVESGVAHSSFNQLTLSNDIALLRVNKPIVFKANVKAIPLATGKVADGAACVLSGWGILKYEAGARVPNKLQYVDLRVESQTNCKKSWSYVDSSQICTFTKVDQGACKGDSGGPLVANGQQIGIVSFGRPCALGTPDVYTRVSSFLNWIKQQQSYMQDNEEPESSVDMDEEMSSEFAQAFA